MAQRTTVEAPSVAAVVAALAALPHETRAVVTATENGAPWAHVEVRPLTDTSRSAFPVCAEGVRGDTRKRGQSGVIVGPGSSDRALRVVVERARRMAREEG